MKAFRIEKSAKPGRHGIHDSSTHYQSGRRLAVDMEKDEFIGKAALTGKKGKQSKRLVTIALTSDDAPLLLHDEPIFCNGKIIGLTTSGAWGFRVNKSLGIASLEHSDGINGQFLASREFEIEVACERYPIEVRLGGFYDPKNERMKGCPQT